MKPSRVLFNLMPALLPVLAFAQAGDYRIEPDPSATVTLSVTKTGLMKGKVHHFTFPKYSGKLHYDAASPEQSRIEMRFDIAAATHEPDEWLKPDDLVKVLKYMQHDVLHYEQNPQLIFVSRSVKKTGPGQFDVVGTLTVKGIDAPETVHAKVSEVSGGLKVEGDSSILLSTYKIKPPSAALGAVGTENEMGFHFVVLAKK